MSRNVLSQFKPDVLNNLGRSTLTLLSAAHHDLLRRFADSKTNEMRLEIRCFRRLAFELARWAETDDGLSELAHRAHWCECYWYEREYGDSQFEAVSKSEALTFPGLFRKYVRNNVRLAAPLLLVEDVILQLRMSNSLLLFCEAETCLTNLAYGWTEIMSLLSSVGGDLRYCLEELLRAALSNQDPSLYSTDLLDLLADCTQSIRLDVDDSPISIRMTFLADDRVTINKVFPDQHAEQWARRRLRERRYEYDVEQEGLSEFGDLMDTLLAA